MTPLVGLNYIVKPEERTELRGFGFQVTRSDKGTWLLYLPHEHSEWFPYEPTECGSYDEAWARAWRYYDFLHTTHFFMWTTTEGKFPSDHPAYDKALQEFMDKAR